MDGAVSNRADRRSRGAYYTPVEVARHITRLALQPLLDQGATAGLSSSADQLATAGQASISTPIRVLDPACGDGVFLLAAGEQLANAVGKNADTAEASQLRGNIAQQCLHGIDINAEAVDDCRRRVAEWVVGDAADAKQHEKWIERLKKTIVHGNALLEPHASVASGIVSAPAQIFEKNFDCVIGNPPYINIRLASQTLEADLRSELRKRFRTARGGYDLYVLFLELGCRLLRPGGRFGWIVPNKLAGADYAKACRELLTTEATIERWEDLSFQRVFAEAGVYPQIIVGSNLPAPSGFLTHATRIGGTGETSIQKTKLGKSPWRMTASLDVESHVETIPLGKLATLHSGATGFQAQRLAGELVEATDASEESNAFPFITSGNIDRYQIEDTNVRFMKRRFQRAYLPCDAAMLTDRKRRLYASAKIVIAGMTKRLEAAYDTIGRALGVQVYVAIDFDCDPYYLLGVLNSRLISDLFRERFPAKQLSGGYLSINKGQLAELPIADPSRYQDFAREIATLAKRMSRLRSADAIDRCDEQLDQCVRSLYGLASDQLPKAA